MNKAFKVVLLVALLAAVLLLSGCNLSASKAPAVKATATSEIAFMTSTPGENVAGDIATQTAAAQPAVATATSAPAAQATAVPPTNTPAPAQQQQVSVPTLTRPSTYTLQKGEWPICIARRFDLDLSSFFSANGLTMNSRPGVGTVLKIPSSGTWSSGSYGSRILHKHADYKVNAGDSVYTIACYFGDVSPEAILAVNGLNSASDVKSGMTLKIP
jgi:LysM repeat protein